MLSPNLLTHDQEQAIDRLYNKDETMLIAGMGSGKTIISLTAIQELIAAGELERVLIFAPLKVVESVWRQEACKWSHTNKLEVQLCTGTPEQRKVIVSHAQKTKGILFFLETKTPGMAIVNGVLVAKTTSPFREAAFFLVFSANERKETIRLKKPILFS